MAMKMNNGPVALEVGLGVSYFHPRSQMTPSTAKHSKRAVQWHFRVLAIMAESHHCRCVERGQRVRGVAMGYKECRSRVISFCGEGPDHII